MGIPRFFKWISERYPLSSKLIEAGQVPPFDNFYLDMNGIIHKCSHGDSTLNETNETETFRQIFEYVERLYSIIQPQKLFFISIDGVAPRAKMNQQRSRRFRSAKEKSDLVKKELGKGRKVPENIFDSNCITPGTEFMERLDIALRYFISRKISTDERWQGIEVVLSGHEVPGEGEHKIMEYIRHAKAQPGYDPNIRHCLYGLDADLIVLGLVSHDPHFVLLREEITFGKNRQVVPQDQRFYLLHLGLIREYLALEFGDVCASFAGSEFSMESVIDDFVLIVVLIGNDFVPCINGLGILEGSMGDLFSSYKSYLASERKFLNKYGEVSLQNLEKFFRYLHPLDLASFDTYFEDCMYTEKEKLIAKYGAKDSKRPPTDLATTPEYLRFFEQWRAKYYAEHFPEGVPARSVVSSFVNGIRWTMKYYYSGVESWSWFYPYNYGPFASDMIGLLGMASTFELGRPFAPFEQLMAVLPPDCASLVPSTLRPLMTDVSSPIIDFYPTAFKTDKRHAKMPWEEIPIIPFVDEQRLLDAVRPLYESLSMAEKMRNEFGPSMSFQYAHGASPVYRSFDRKSFPDFSPNNCSMKVFDLPLLRPDMKFVYGLCKGVQTGIHIIAGFPTLHTLEFDFCLAKIGIKIHQSPSNNDSLVLCLRPRMEFTGKTMEAIAFRVLSRSIVYVGWPFNQEAQPSYVSDEFFTYRLKNRHTIRPGTTNYSQFIEKTPHTNQSILEHESNWDRCAYKHLTKMGIRLNEVESGPEDDADATTVPKNLDLGTNGMLSVSKALLHAYLVTGVKTLRDGSVVKRTIRAEFCYPLDTIVLEIHNRDERLLEYGPNPQMATNYSGPGHGPWRKPENGRVHVHSRKSQGHFQGHCSEEHFAAPSELSREIPGRLSVEVGSKETVTGSRSSKETQAAPSGLREPINPAPAGRRPSESRKQNAGRLGRIEAQGRKLASVPQADVSVATNPPGDSVASSSQTGSTIVGRNDGVDRLATEMATISIVEKLKKAKQKREHLDKPQSGPSAEPASIKQTQPLDCTKPEESGGNKMAPTRPATADQGEKTKQRTGKMGRAKGDQKIARIQQKGPPQQIIKKDTGRSDSVNTTAQPGSFEQHGVSEPRIVGTDGVQKGKALLDLLRKSGPA